jgi:hypothetical protein
LVLPELLLRWLHDPHTRRRIDEGPPGGLGRINDRDHVLHLSEIVMPQAVLHMHLVVSHVRPKLLVS